jgi:hypothetical protein
LGGNIATIAHLSALCSRLEFRMPVDYAALRLSAGLWREDYKTGQPAK